MSGQTAGRRRAWRRGSGALRAAPAQDQPPPASAWIGRSALALTTWNAHALNARNTQMRRRRYGALRALASGSDILLVQEIHGSEGDFGAVEEALRVSHAVFGSPAASAAAGGTGIAISWALLAE